MADEPTRYPRPLPRELLEKHSENVRLNVMEEDLQTAGGGMRQTDAQMRAEGQDPYREDILFGDLMKSNTKDSWLLNWGRIEDNLYDKTEESNRGRICQNCGENTHVSNKAASLGIDIMGTGLCQKCSNEGYLARF